MNAGVGGSSDGGGDLLEASSLRLEDLIRHEDGVGSDPGDAGGVVGAGPDDSGHVGTVAVVVLRSRPVSYDVRAGDDVELVRHGGRS